MLSIAFLLGARHLGEVVNRNVEAEKEAGSGNSESGPFSVEVEARKIFRFHIGYLT